MGLRPRRTARSRFRPDAADLRGVRRFRCTVGLRGRSLGCIGLHGLFLSVGLRGCFRGLRVRRSGPAVYPRGHFRSGVLRGSTARRLDCGRFRRIVSQYVSFTRPPGALRGRLLRRSLCVRSRIVPLLPLRRGPYPLRRAVQRRLGRSLRHAAHRLHGGLRGRLCRFRQRQLRVGKRRSLGRYAPLRRPIGKRRCAACGRVFAPNISRNAFLGGPRTLSAHLPGKPLRAPAKPPRSGRRSVRLGGCVLPDGLVKALADVHRRVGKRALLLLLPEPVDPGQQALLRLTPAAALLPPQRVEDHLHVQPDVLPRLRRGRLRPRRLLQKVQRGAAVPPLSRLRPVDQLLRKGLRQRAEGRQGRTLRVQRPHIRFCHPNGVHLHAPVIHKFDPVHRQLHLIAVELRAFVPDQMRSRHRPLPDGRAEAVL